MYALRTKAKVKERVSLSFHGLTERTDEVERHSRTILQTKAGQPALLSDREALQILNVDPILALV